MTTSVKLLRESGVIPHLGGDLRDNMAPYGQIREWVNPLPLDACDIGPGMGWRPIYLPAIFYSPWDAIEFMHIQGRPKAETESIYKCPFIRRKFNGLVPLILFTQEAATAEGYQNSLKNYLGNVPDSAFDEEWVWGFLLRSGNFDQPQTLLTDRLRAMMGTGEMNTDGGAFLHGVSLKLDNGDWIYALAWTWAPK